jgi:hypothetical protein
VRLLLDLSGLKMTGRKMWVLLLLPTTSITIWRRETLPLLLPTKITIMVMLIAGMEQIGMKRTGKIKIFLWFIPSIRAIVVVTGHHYPSHLFTAQCRDWRQCRDTITFATTAAATVYAARRCRPDLHFTGWPVSATTASRGACDTPASAAKPPNFGGGGRAHSFKKNISSSSCYCCRVCWPQPLFSSCCQICRPPPLGLVQLKVR